MAARNSKPESYSEKTNFTNEEIDSSIHKLELRIAELDKAKEENWMHNSGKVDALREKIRSTIEEAWGTKSRKTAESYGAEIEDHYAYVGAEQHEYQSIFQNAIPNAIERLRGHIEILEEKRLKPSFPTHEFPWSMLHAEIQNVCQKKFYDGHYADAVESAMKAINTRVKEHHKRFKGVELDGVSLMQQAFSPNGPSIVFSDLVSESGKNEQLGYKDIFAGAMQGIRNPKAHQNLTIPSDRALHMLVLASLLMKKLDDAGVS